MRKMRYEVRMVAEEVTAYPQVSCSEDLEKVFRPLFFEDQYELQCQEGFAIMALTRQNEPIAMKMLHVGTSFSVAVDMKLIMGWLTAIPNCAAFAVCHNHPSGKTNPSAADDSLTNCLTVIGELMGVQLIDHVILTERPHNSYSYADRGRMNEIRENAKRQTLAFSRGWGIE